MQRFTPDTKRRATTFLACGMDSSFQSAALSHIDDKDETSTFTFRCLDLHNLELSTLPRHNDEPLNLFSGSGTRPIWLRINSLHRRFKLSPLPLIQTRGFSSFLLRATNLGVGTTSGRDSLCGTEPGGRSDISPHLPLTPPKKRNKGEGKKTGKTWKVFGKPGFQTLSRTKKKKKSFPHLLPESLHAVLHPDMG